MRAIYNPYYSGEGYRHPSLLNLNQWSDGSSTCARLAGYKRSPLTTRKNGKGGVAMVWQTKLVLMALKSSVLCCTCTFTCWSEVDSPMPPCKITGRQSQQQIQPQHTFASCCQQHLIKSAKCGSHVSGMVGRCGEWLNEYHQIIAIHL